MAKLLHGDRIAKLGQIMLGCSAVILDASGQSVLLTRRTDNGLWCLPGGRIDPGECVAEACAREVLEETGLKVLVGRLLGVYSDPNLLVEYADGERCHIVALNFAAEAIAGTLSLSNETTAFGYFSREEMQTLNLMEHHWERIDDAFADQPEAFVR
jgi:ADP-ribose pyrophosphatase YjhB (NUDIX family)